MANKLYDETSIQNIANAIRSKNGSSDLYTVGQMAQAISNIPTGAGTLVFFDNLELTNDVYIRLPQTLLSPDISYYFEFTTLTQADATGDKYIFGIENNYGYNFIGIRYGNLRYQVGQNGNSTNQTNSWEELVGKHSFLYDGAGNVSFDNGVKTYIYYPETTTGDGYNILIGTQGDPPNLTNGWHGLVHRFTIKNVTTDTLIADYKPAAIMNENTVVRSGLYDVVNEVFAEPPKATVSNDES